MNNPNMTIELLGIYGVLLLVFFFLRFSNELSCELTTVTRRRQYNVMNGVVVIGVLCVNGHRKRRRRGGTAQADTRLKLFMYGSMRVCHNFCFQLFIVLFDEGNS